MSRTTTDLLWLFDQVAFEHGFKLPDRQLMSATRPYWHEPSGFPDGVVEVLREGDDWVAYDGAQIVARSNDLRQTFQAAEGYIDEQERAVAL